MATEDEHGGPDAVLPHELTDEMERGALGDDRPRPRATPDRLPPGGPGGESTSGRYESAVWAFPLLATLGLLGIGFLVGLVAVIVALASTPSAGIPAYGPAVKGAVFIAIVVAILVLAATAVVWATRRNVAEWFAQRDHGKRRSLRQEMLLQAFNCHVERMTQVGIGYGLVRALPPGTFSDFIGYIDLRPDAVEVWWVRGREAGGFLVPKAWIARVWPVELWLKGTVPASDGPPELVVPYIEYVDPRTQTTRILSFEAAESVVPDRIAEESKWLAERLCKWFYGKSLAEVYVPTRLRAPGGGWADGG